MTMATAIAAGVAVAAVVLGAAASLLCAPQLLFGSFALPVFFFFLQSTLNSILVIHVYLLIMY